ncbi:MAG: hypothetical protein IGQ45_10515 [Cyanobacterium sp. T60_A2020_053]|nr:hypothetical protein [Cyanobacterium sp. T60_A2020_053]
MMAVVKVILNTDDTWLGVDNPTGDTIQLFQASDTDQRLNLTPYGTGFDGGIEVAIADVNYLESKFITVLITS